MSCIFIIHSYQENSHYVKVLAISILISFIGRLVRHIRESDKLDLTALRFLIIDEADRMIMNITDDWLNLLEAAVFR